MNRIRNILSFLLIAGVACVHAQQPIVKINSDTAAECDVTAPAGAPIFQLDATGNVLISGVMSGTGCGNSGGGSNTPTFGLSPPASGVVINFGSTTVAADSTATVPFTYQAYYADSCSVGTPTTTGTCPAITASNGSCTGAAANNKACAPTSATLSIPTSAAMGTNTSCAYSVKATCLPNSVTSTATLTVTKPEAGDPTCSALVPVKTASGANWGRVTGNTSVKYGDGATAMKDATDYVSIWSYPGGTVPWPGNSGLSTRPTASVNQYFAEKFTVPTDGSQTTNVNWAFSGSGINSNMSLTISQCPGDFGQAGSVLTTGCKVNQGASSSGLTATVSDTQVGSFCSLKPGKSYYLNLLPMAPLPVSNVSTTTCTGTCTPWLGQTH